jgi:hypothetical protein
MTLKFNILEKAPTTIKRVENLIAKKDAEYPEDPARDVCNGAEDPITTSLRAENSASEFGNFATLRIISSAQ